tara:strand:- start:209 stop:589 length:381 start_codon:yes stop_codon:yes gene_type:complete
MNHFDYLKSITDSKEDIMVDDLAEKDYNAFMVNRGLSYYNDTVIYANEMNKNSHIDSRLQFDFLKQIIRKRKRFSKWNKADKLADIEVIKEYYGYSRDKAYQVLPLLSKDKIDHLRKKISKGGRNP